MKLKWIFFLLCLIAFSAAEVRADLVVISTPHLIMNEGSITEADFTVLNDGSFSVDIFSNFIQNVFLTGDPTDRPSDLIGKEPLLPTIGPGESFVFRYNVISSFDDFPFEPIDSGFSALVIFIEGDEVGTGKTVFVQGNGDVTVKDVAVPEPSTAFLLATGFAVLVARLGARRILRLQCYSRRRTH